ncbi:MAG: porphobilinogen synthase [Candidatus Methanogasteraceae archaeon]
MFPKTRMRRLRQDRIRNLVAETELSAKDLICPIFVDETIKEPVEIESMPGQYRVPLDTVADEAKEIEDLGIPAIILFGIPETKDEEGTGAYDDSGVIQQAVQNIRNVTRDLTIITDVCLCEYTTHGHCGIVDYGTKTVLNDPTLLVLGKVAVSHARAGADIVAPSGMMDGMVRAIRTALDIDGFTDTPIMSYSAKYCSCFYGPFRDAADSGYAFGDRSGYQMDPANANEALREVELDIDEGADIVMVKPAMPYLDVLRRVKTRYMMPTAAYQVSGEYAMIAAASRMGWLDYDQAVHESLLAIKRSGADMIITYFAKDAARMLSKL